MILAAVAPLYQAANKCKALVLSGGGSNGAWEAGVLWGLLHNGDPTNYEWDHITGISAGSINTAGLVGWAIGDELLATEWLSDTMENAQTSDIWIEYPEGLVKALTERPSLLDTSPFIPWLTDVLSDDKLSGGFKRNFTIGTLNVESGEFTTFNRDNITFGEELATAAVCSSSIPIVFPPTHFKDRYFVDGGTVWDVNISSAINGCLDIVDDESQITVDILICGNSEIKTEPSTETTIGNLLRSHQISSYYAGMNAIAAQMRAFPNVNWRYLFE